MRGGLQGVAEAGRECQDKDRCRKSLRSEPQRKMGVNTKPDDMVNRQIQNSPGSTLLVGQPRELPIRVVENVRDDMQCETNEIEEKRAIKVKVPGNNSENSADHRDCARREP